MARAHDPFSPPAQATPAEASADPAVPAVALSDSSPSLTDEVLRTIESAMEWVGDDRERAATVLAAELARPAGPRKTLVSRLEGMLGDG